MPRGRGGGEERWATRTQRRRGDPRSVGAATIGTCRFDPTCDYALEPRAMVAALRSVRRRCAAARSSGDSPTRRASSVLDAPAPRRPRRACSRRLHRHRMRLGHDRRCAGTIDAVTKSDPLSVKEGQVDRGRGQHPARVGEPEPEQLHDREGRPPRRRRRRHHAEHKSTGAKYQSEGIDVDDYLQYGAGLYQVHVTNRARAGRASTRAT